RALRVRGDGSRELARRLLDGAEVTPVERLGREDLAAEAERDRARLEVVAGLLDLDAVRRQEGDPGERPADGLQKRDAAERPDREDLDDARAGAARGEDLRRRRGAGREEEPALARRGDDARVGHGREREAAARLL